MFPKLFSLKSNTIFVFFQELNFFFFEKNLRMLKLIRHLIGALLVLTLLVDASSAFHYHHLMAAALLANLQRTPFVPLPIPIPIPVKAGGNTIIA